MHDSKSIATKAKEILSRDNNKDNNLISLETYLMNASKNMLKNANSLSQMKKVFALDRYQFIKSLLALIRKHLQPESILSIPSPDKVVYELDRRIRLALNQPSRIEEVANKIKLGAQRRSFCV